ncbi:MAG: helix-turn-helix domain-containing protein [Ruminococcus sp.]|nr:helix-turn-helix domain-containing protein [Ruminococcus sp.]
MIDSDFFFICEKISELRYERGVSARDMSLSLGQNQNYINNIENKKTLPSVPMLIYICDYLHISPAEFFSEEDCPIICNDILHTVKDLTPEQQSLILNIAKEFKKRK